jgi:xanthine dehydrogenase small subunit
MKSVVSFVLDDQVTELQFKQNSGLKPTTTVLQYLRSLPNHRGVKEGCAEGDCGACTVVLGELGGDNQMRYRAVDSCLVFLPMIHGKQLITIENLRAPDSSLHPVQEALVKSFGSQCGFCTPGIVMSLFALYKTNNNPTRTDIEDALSGNLCRCTGYRPIIEAAENACVNKGVDHFSKKESDIIKLLKRINDHAIAIETATQRYYQPGTVEQALELNYNNPQALLICGATDIALRYTKNHELLSNLIDISNIHELKHISDDNRTLKFGAATLLNSILPVVRESFPALHHAIRFFGSNQIRNMATIAGNIVTASPIGDLPPVLMAYNAIIKTHGKMGKRNIELQDFISGYRKTVLQQDEIISEIEIPKLNDHSMVKFYKISKRQDVDISSVSGAFRLERNGNHAVKDIKLIYGGMAEMTKRAGNAEAFLKKKTWDRYTVEQAMPLLEKDFSPISDARSSAQGRITAAKNLLLKFWWDTQNEL